ncbi:chloride channel protein [Cocleimonas sp. KMM 6892]|uniref:chloride channel protein n=1 Tax=unclassified Cocleimonas TaxID=2639732 RepID=UPI002DB7BCC6|nr:MULTISPECIES: chloride channel protein [unclassified Cocleimonas]MEB8431365.1 chloride channel protein [Cocleimonas sp. KMM 6892]MEC4713863.1 chloride channel protein [Cocleimonas sp. KMM 6895]MEC4743194.1 chloride channel protein [Cocleimonas sp. KMM 6896]
MTSDVTFIRISYRIIVLTLLALTLGSIASLAAIAFIEAVDWMNDILLISPRSRIQLNNPFLLTAATVLVPAIGGLIVGFLIQKLTIEKRPLGPADAIKAVQLRTSLPDARSGFVSTLASLVSLGSGASVGQYGPMVYMGAIAGNFASRLKLDIPNIQTIAIACGVAAAISTAFNAPIAGLVFAHEVILRHYSLQAFAPTTVASATGYVFANIIFDSPPLFLVHFNGVAFGYEFLLFAILGLVCAFLAVIFMRLLASTSAFSEKLSLPAIYKPAIAGLAVGIIALQFPDVLGIGKEALRFATIEGAFSSGELILLLIAKMVLTALCLGFGFAGGVFSPSLLIGILFGALCWTFLNFIGIPNSGVVVYAICAMMALTSPIIGAPLTTILIVFELTHNYDLTIAAMVSVVFANLLAYRLHGRSIFDVVLASKGVDLSSGRDRAMLENINILTLDNTDFANLKDTSSIEESLIQLKQAGRSAGAITNHNNEYLGVVRTIDLIGEESQAITNLIRKDMPVLNEKTSLWQAMSALEGFTGEAVPIIDSSNGELIGMVPESELITAYQKIAKDIKNEENEGI